MACQGQPLSNGFLLDSSCFPSFLFSSLDDASSSAIVDENVAAASFDGYLVCSVITNQEASATTENKRKSRSDETNLSTVSTQCMVREFRQAESTKEGKSKKQKRVAKKTEEKKQSSNSDGYVRAKRGQATDSHSLAERVRREKISERMKMLQGLVPGCDKVTGKALMLDEIINYVQSLQNQVEFLSMKIASLSPVLYDFNADLVDCIDQQQPQPCMELSNPLQPQAKAYANEAFTDYQLMGHATGAHTSFSQGSNPTRNVMLSLVLSKVVSYGRSTAMEIASEQQMMPKTRLVEATGRDPVEGEEGDNRFNGTMSSCRHGLSLKQMDA
ncbi:hypothetical protein ZIOFF_063499 [Zingiber officinale]|uniref:BHLH domain-containing protein n=1 Tax=Zingiber officinale TaxID=94328 RepID=A0A8J5F1P6_ZINOF|nr:hypothetical protein ZIOFF_063499 [Zingiber officinale]